MNSNDFLIWEQLSRDTIDVKRVYIDIAGDLVAGILLSQIIYWNLPSQEGKSKLRVKKKDELWLAKSREDWWEECRITPKQYDRAIKILESKDLVEKQIFKFSGNPTTHIRLKLDVLTQYLSVITQKGKTVEPLETPFSTKGEERNLPKGNNEVPQRDISITENTITKNTNTEITFQKDKNLISSLEENNSNNTINSINTIYLSPKEELEKEGKKENKKIESIKPIASVENTLKCTNYTSRATKKEFDNILKNSCYNQFQEKNAIEQALRLLYFSSKPLRINDMQVPADQVREDMKKINWSTLEFAIRDFTIQSKQQEIKYPVGYLSRCIYNAIFQGELKMDAELRYHGLI